MITVKNSQDQLLYTLEDHLQHKWTDEPVVVPLVDLANIVNLSLFMMHEPAITRMKMELKGDFTEPRVYIAERT